jgi:hypothetical protein
MWTNVLKHIDNPLQKGFLSLMAPPIVGFGLVSIRILPLALKRTSEISGAILFMIPAFFGLLMALGMVLGSSLE